MTFPRVRIPPRAAQRKGFSPTAGGHNHEFRKRRLPPETEERPLRRTVLLEVGHSGRCRPLGCRNQWILAVERRLMGDWTAYLA